MTTPAGVAVVPWFNTTTVKRPVVVLYVSEVGMRSGRGPDPEIVIVCESWLLVLSSSTMRSTSSANTVIVCVPGEMVQGPPSEPMVTDAPAARGPLTAPQVQYAPSTEYETPTTTPAGVAAVPWFFTTLVKRPVVLSYESEVGIRSGSCPDPETVIVCESMLLVLSNSTMRSTSSTNAVIVCVPLAMAQGPPS